MWKLRNSTFGFRFRSGSSDGKSGEVTGRGGKAKPVNSTVKDRRPDDAMRDGDPPLGGVLTNPIWCYYGFIISVILLTCIGLVMVFSSSSVRMISNGKAPWQQGVSQVLYCFGGVVTFLIASHLPAAFYQRLGFVFCWIAIVLQALTLSPVGREINGNRSWIGVGSVTLQPAEVVKLALCIWLPLALTQARKRLDENDFAPTPTFVKLEAYIARIGNGVLRDWAGSLLRGFRAYFWSLFMFMVPLLLVLKGDDLGTAMIIILIGGVAFFIGGFPTKTFWSAAVLMVVTVVYFVVSKPNRLDRVLSAYRPCKVGDTTCYQSLHSKYAIASGGFFGVGLGNSREKWNYLPEAHNDFIFAIICEELGFIGAVLIVLLFIIIAWCLIIVALRNENHYASIVLVCATMWIVGQALINIMVVLGLLPVMGVPLPFVSAGGSSLVMCLTVAGVCISMMRCQPQIAASISAKRV